MDLSPRTLGMALWLMRHFRGRTQKQIAEEAAVTPAMLSVYESGRHLPSLKSLTEILRALGASFADLEDALGLVEQRSEPAAGTGLIASIDPTLALRRLGVSLRTLRTQRNKTLAEVAREANLTRAMLSAYEQGHRQPGLHNLDRLLRALGASWGDLDEVLGPSARQAGARADTVAEPAVEYGASAPYSMQVAGEVLRRLEELDREYEHAGRSLDELAPAPELAARMVALVPSPSPWDGLLGPVYVGRQVEALLGDVSRQAVAERRRRRTLLGLRTADGAWVYPAFQFGDQGDVLEALPSVLQCFDEDAVDDWTLAGWLVSPLSTLGGTSPVERLRSGGDPAPVLAAARDAARRFAQ